MRRLLIVTVVAAMGCGDIVPAATDAGPPDANGDAQPPDPCLQDEIAVEDFAACAKQAYCDGFDCLGITFPFCYVQDAGFPLFDPILPLIEAGTVLYDPAAAAACVEAYSNFCRNGDSDTQACIEYLTGTLADGQPCYHDDECGEGGLCIEEDVNCTMQCCLGLCAHADQPLFSDCSDSPRCDHGLHCVGDTCLTGEDAAPCNSASDCDIDHYCNSDGECTPDVQENDACEDDSWCPVPLRCVGDALPAGVGTCGRVDAEDAPCDSPPSFTLIPSCLGGLYCKGFSLAPEKLGACTALPGDGEDCTGIARCDSNDLYCNAGSCAPRATSSESCAGGVLCAPGLICNTSMVCSAPLELNQACGGDFDCRSGICAGPMGNQTCQAPADCYAN